MSLSHLQSRVFAVILALFAVPIAGAILEQSSTVEQPRFEVVSVKPVGRLAIRIQSGSAPVQVPAQGFRYTPGRLTCTLPLSPLIQEAYSVKSWQVVGPDWLTTDRYDLAATMPSDTDWATARVMLQTMLAERFSLRFHRERKESPVYALLVSKAGMKAEPVVPKPEYYNISTSAGHFAANGIPLPALADSMSRMVDLPVVDMTGMTDVYRIDMRWTPDYQDEPKHWDAGVFAAVEKLGLKLERRKVPVESILIDHVERVPNGN